MDGASGRWCPADPTNHGHGTGTEHGLIACTIALLATGWILSGEIDWQAAFGEDAAVTAIVTPAPTAVAPPTIPQVRVTALTAEPFVEEMILQGRTLADRTVTIRAETYGVVEEVEVERGQAVQGGALLVRLEVQDREARVVEAEALLRERELEWEAASSLNQRGFRADTQLAQAVAQLDSARAGLSLAHIELDNIHLRAPFDGVVADRYVELGDFVDVGDSIASVIDLDPLRIVVQVAERYLGRIQVGDYGWAELVDGRRVDGVVGYVGPTANEATRTFPIELEVPNADARVIEGLTAEVHLPVDQVEAHYVTPMVLTLSDDGRIGVKAVDAADRVVFYPVEIIAGDDGGVWLNGLPPNVTVIVVGQEFVVAGDRVEPIPAEMSSQRAGL